MRTRRISAAIAIAACVAIPAAHAAQPAYPDKTIRLIIGSAPGSGPDIMARLIADHLDGVWGQRVLVDARPGVAGIISAEQALQANPDGYTWMMLTSQLMVASNVFRDHKVNLARDFSSVSLIGSVPFVLAVHPSVAKTIPELIDVAKKSQPSLRYGSSGTGATEHLSAFLFTRMTNTNMLHVPYKGIGQSIADVMSREVHLTFAALPAVLPMAQSGRVRALGVSTRKRATLLPDIPAISEVVPGYEIFGWYSIVMPTGVPKDIITKVGAEVVKAVKDPAFGERLKDLGIEAAGSSITEFDAFRADQTRRLTEIVKALGTELK